MLHTLNLSEANMKSNNIYIKIDKDSNQNLDDYDQKYQEIIKLMPKSAEEKAKLSREQHAANKKRAKTIYDQNFSEKLVKDNAVARLFKLRLSSYFGANYKRKDYKTYLANRPDAINFLNYGIAYFEKVKNTKNSKHQYMISSFILVLILENNINSQLSKIALSYLTFFKHDARVQTYIELFTRPERVKDNISTFANNYTTKKSDALLHSFIVYLRQNTSVKGDHAKNRDELYKRTNSAIEEISKKFSNDLGNLPHGSNQRPKTHDDSTDDESSTKENKLIPSFKTKSGKYHSDSTDDESFTDDDSFEATLPSSSKAKSGKPHSESSDDDTTSKDEDSSESILKSSILEVDTKSPTQSLFNFFNTQSINDKQLIKSILTKKEEIFIKEEKISEAKKELDIMKRELFELEKTFLSAQLEKSPDKRASKIR